MAKWKVTGLCAICGVVDLGYADPSDDDEIERLGYAHIQDEHDGNGNIV